MGSKLRRFRILVVDDSELQRTLYKKRVLFPDEKGEFLFEIYEADTGKAAKELIEKLHPDLVILDFNLPDIKGTDIIKWMENNGFNDIQTILVSSIDNSDLATTGLNLGAEDFVKIPYDPEELRARVKAHLRLKRIIDYNRETRERYKKLSQIDGLTELFNRRYLFHKLNDLFKKYRRHGKHLSILMLDIDDFKLVNDTYGHQVGDIVLKKIAEILKKETRKFDIVGRYGGEEFLIVAPGISKDKALKLAERIRKRVKDEEFEADGKKFRVSISIGISELIDDNPRDVNDLVKIADMRLYKAKLSGKDCVVTN